MGLSCFKETNLFIRTNEPNEKFFYDRIIMFDWTKYSVCGSIISHKKFTAVNLSVLALSDLHNGFLARGVCKQYVVLT